MLTTFTEEINSATNRRYYVIELGNYVKIMLDHDEAATLYRQLRAYDTTFMEQFMEVNESGV